VHTCLFFGDCIGFRLLRCLKVDFGADFVLQCVGVNCLEFCEYALVIISDGIQLDLDFLCHTHLDSFFFCLMLMTLQKPRFLESDAEKIIKVLKPFMYISSISRYKNRRIKTIKRSNYSFSTVCFVILS
jgi:hypothetical protein